MKFFKIKNILFILIYLVFIISLFLSVSINIDKIPLILAILIFIYYLIFRIDFKLAFSLCLLMLLLLPILLISNNYKIADKIANYTYFLILFIVPTLYLNSWREKLEKTGRVNVYYYVLVFIILIVIFLYFIYKLFL